MVTKSWSPDQVMHRISIAKFQSYKENIDYCHSAFLTIAELFSKLHNTVNAAPKYRLMFLLSESGPLLNFQGMKKWLDENLQIQNVDFVICLDTITQPLDSDSSDALYMHVSKPPKEGTPMSNFYKLLKNTATKYNNITVDGVHKKIFSVSAENFCLSEHEIFHTTCTHKILF